MHMMMGPKGAAGDSRWLGQLHGISGGMGGSRIGIDASNITQCRCDEDVNHSQRACTAGPAGLVGAARNRSQSGQALVQDTDITTLTSFCNTAKRKAAQAEVQSLLEDINPERRQRTVSDPEGTDGSARAWRQIPKCPEP